MKRYVHAYAMCRSMFCYIPSPWRVWDEEARPLMPLFLPVLGLELGALWYALAWGLARIALPLPMAACLLCLYPYAVSGAIHLDGFMDVTDALRSCASPERRREILKDPHVGSFAVVGCVLVLLAGYSCFLAGGLDLRLLVMIPAVSRCGSALAVTLLPALSTSQYASQSMVKGHAAAVLSMACLAIAAGFFLCGRGGFALVIQSAAYGAALYRGYRGLGGMNGDIAGYALTLSELCAVAAAVLL